MGDADAMLASHNTVLNFRAIIDRLDNTYTDKTPIQVLTQELNFLGQGELSLTQYYNNIRQKLTLLTNKTLMTQDTVSATILNKKFREDALHAFISGLKKFLRTAVFPAQPRDLPTALALAR